MKKQAMLIAVAVCCVIGVGTLCFSADVDDFFDAIYDGDIQKVEALLAQGANINDNEPMTGDTPLMAAASLGNAAMVRMLISKGADMNVEIFGDTALSLAESMGHTDVAQILRDAGAQ